VLLQTIKQQVGSHMTSLFSFWFDGDN